VQIARAGETMFWLPAPRALIAGDRIIGIGQGRLTICPQSWLDYLPSGMTVSELGRLLRPLLELPIKMVLVSHGDPVLLDGHRALTLALDSATSAT
jgi:hypothetical protein